MRRILHAAARLSFASCLLAALLASEHAHARSLTQEPERVSTIPEAQLPEVLSIVAREYYRPASSETLLELARARKLETLDPYSTFLGPIELARFDRTLAGSFAGIGVVLDEVPAQDGFRIRGPMPGSPALAAGLRADDVIVSIDGHASKGLGFEEFVAQLQGPAGSPITLELRPLAGGESRRVTLERRAVALPTVRGRGRNPAGAWDFMLAPAGVAYLRITSFAETTAAEFEDAWTAIEKQKPSALVLDLRDCIGGLASAAIEVADRFLDSGRIVTFRQRDAHGETCEVHEASPGARVGVPVAILVSPDTISAAELLAAALQDNHRATVVGARTYGKATAQKIFRLAQDAGAIKLTVAVYERPSGEAIERHLAGSSAEAGGVWPDPEGSIQASEEQWARWGNGLFELDRTANIAADHAVNLALGSDPVLERAVELLGIRRAQAPAELDSYDLAWHTPSADASGSMPIGNGEVGCNVWCEPDGRVRFYVSRTDSFSESSRLLKLGEASLQLRAPLSGEFFEQRLCLREGCIRITLGEGERRVALELFVDSDSDVVHVVGESARDEQPGFAVRTWRTQEKRLEGGELDSSWTMRGAPQDVSVVESADRALARGFAHRNESSVTAFTLARQGLAADAADPLLHRTFGLLHEEHVEPRRFEFALAAPCLVAKSLDEWQEQASSLLRTPSKTAKERTSAWWRAFWDRSYVFVSGDASSAGVPTNAHPLRIGVDSGGGNVFHGTIADVKVQDGDEVVYAAASGAVPRTIDALEGRAFTHALRLEATVTQDAAHPVGRILDKLTAGASDGFLFDTHPGHALRLIVGERILIAENALPAGEAHRVAASFDPASGRMQLFRDGTLVASSAASADAPPRSRLTQAWLLQRWMQACGGRGHFPIKFNGSIFTVEPRFTGGEPYDADWRKWGDCFWWQNTRLPYYPMLAQGDFEMQEPLFRLYRDTLPVAKQRVRAWYGGKAQGAYWPETMTPFGAHANGDYGWERKDLPPSKVLCPWWEYARNQGLELLALMLDRWDYERDPQFLASELVPLAEPVLAWFESAYPRDAHGTLRITPTQAIETYWNGVEDDMPTVAGLRWVLPRLVALPKDALPDALRERWAKLAAALPPLPRREHDGRELLAPAAKYDPARSNCESPELYAVFPFRHFGLGKPELELARASFARRADRFTNGWPQDGQDAALLGLVDEARANVLAKARNDHKAHRFPAMWGPNFDWCPDQDHGSNLLDTTERMLLQCEGDVIRVLPCWPKEWDVSFKLHAPQRTVVEVVWRAGKLERLEVTPRERAKDVVVGGG